jgi:predicted outer membrane repeat protein
MARVGKGRVLLDQGQFADAAIAVADVPLTFSYNVAFSSGASIYSSGFSVNIWNYLTYPYNYGTPPYIILDHEGQNGLPWSTDPRIPIATDNGTNYPAKYDNESAPIRLADGIEAQMIRAEASLNAGTSDWLTILNTVRATCTTASGCAPVPGIDVGTLPPLTDSGTAVGRLREVMSERAYWMYATGHRAGDLRRMLRPPYNAAPYNLTQSSVYPTGVYTNPHYTGPTAAYGTDVVAIPRSMSGSSTVSTPVASTRIRK